MLAQRRTAARRTVGQRFLPLASRARLRAFGLVAAFAVLAGSTLFLFSAVAPERERPAFGGAVPDLLLVQTWDAATESSALRALIPSANALRPIVDAAGSDRPPRISADGRTLAFVQTVTSGDELVTSVVTLETGSLRTIWTRQLSVEPVPVPPSFATLRSDIAFAGDRLYAALHRADSDDPITIIAWEVADGREVGRWQTATGGVRLDAVVLRSTAAGDRLTLLGSLADGMSSGEPRVAAIQFDLPTMRERWRVFPSESSDGVGVWAWESRITPDGATLYSLGYASGGSDWEVRFFDLREGRPLPPVRLGLSNGHDWLYQHVVSHDGKFLYVLASQSSRLAVVNLETHALDATIEIDASAVLGQGGTVFERLWRAARSLVVADAAAKSWFQGTMQLSPDGTRLYAIGLAGDDLSPQPRGVWVIDTSVWQVVDIWGDDIEATQVLLSADGAFLQLLRSSWADNSGEASVAVIDTSTGEQVALIDAGAATQSWSLVDVYRECYGRTPESTIAGEVTGGESAPPVVPFAKLVVDTDVDTTIAGREVVVTARYLHPTTGEALTPETPGVRYAPPDHIVATLTPGSAEREVRVDLLPAGYGVYQGRVTLPGPGVWNVSVLAQRAGEPNRRAVRLAAVTVQAALNGDDGRAYLFRISTEPAEPRADEPFTVRAVLVDADTGAPLPADVSIDGGLPQVLDLAFFLEGNGGVTSAELARDGHGVYAGEARVFDAGTWVVRVTFRNDVVGLVTTGVGAVLAR